MKTRARRGLRSRQRLKNAVQQRTLELQTQNEVILQQKREIEALLRQSEDISRLKSEFLANMSHEIRTPLNGVLGMAQMVLDTPLDAEQRDSVGVIRESAQALQGVINNILDFSKIVAGKVELHEHAFDLRRLVGATVNVYHWKSRAKGLGLVCQVDADVPEVVIGDSSRLRQVLLNLLDNAVKFTEAGSVQLNVSRGGAAADGASGQNSLVFSVEDTGIGIAEPSIEMIFDAFAQVDGTSRRRQGGTGLGLAITAHLVSLLGGRIEVESTLGRGSRFHFTLPFGVPEREAVASARSAAGESSGSRQAGLRILVAEDNRVNQRLIEMALLRMGHRATLVGNGRLALEAVRRESFDVVLMDVQMPEMDGLEATRAIRNAERAAAADGLPMHVPIIAVTAHAMAGDREDCLHSGMDDYIAKPIDVEELRRVLADTGACSKPGVTAA